MAKKIKADGKLNYKMSRAEIEATAKHFAKKIEERIKDGRIERPADYTKEYDLVLGEDILQGNVEYEGELPKVDDPEAYYKLAKPVILGHNIENRLKRALQRGGSEEFIKYINSVGLYFGPKQQKIG